MFGERLKKLRQQKGITQKELAKIIGVERTSIGKYELKYVIPSPDVLKNIADYFDISTDYLLGRYTNKLELVDLGRMRTIAVAGAVRCYEHRTVFDDYDGEISVQAELGNDVFALRCKDDSMTGIGIFDNDVAIVREQGEVDYGELAVVVVDNEIGTIRRVNRKDSVLVLDTANAKYSSQIFIGKDMERVKIIGRLLQVIRKF